MLMIDQSTEFGARVARRLAGDEIIWLTTVGGGGTPQPSPVWFLWDDGQVLIYSEPNTPKLRNIARSPRVALSFNSTPSGSDVVILTGVAELLPDAPLADAVPAYLDKYREGIAGLGMTPEQFATTYYTAIRVTPERLRGF
jgi:PPOX class probable F420-dependent enzyme